MRTSPQITDGGGVIDEEFLDGTVWNVGRRATLRRRKDMKCVQLIQAIDGDRTGFRTRFMGDNVSD